MSFPILTFNTCSISYSTVWKLQDFTLSIYLLAKILWNQLFHKLIIFRLPLPKFAKAKEVGFQFSFTFSSWFKFSFFTQPKQCQCFPYFQWNFPSKYCKQHHLWSFFRRHGENDHWKKKRKKSSPLKVASMRTLRVTKGGWWWSQQQRLCSAPIAPKTETLWRELNVTILSCSGDAVLIRPCAFVDVCLFVYKNLKRSVLSNRNQNKKWK